MVVLFSPTRVSVGFWCSGTFAVLLRYGELLLVTPDFQNKPKSFASA